MNFGFRPSNPVAEKDVAHRAGGSKLDSAPSNPTKAVINNSFWGTNALDPTSQNPTKPVLSSTPVQDLLPVAVRKFSQNL